MVVKMSSSNGSGLALAGSEAASAQTTGGGGPESGTTGSAATVADSNQSDDEHGGDLGSSNDSDSMGFDDDDNGSDLMSTGGLGDDITAQLAAAGNLSLEATFARDTHAIVILPIDSRYSKLFALVCKLERVEMLFDPKLWSHWFVHLELRLTD